MKCEICEKMICPDSNWETLSNIVHCEECLKEYNG